MKINQSLNYHSNSMLKKCLVKIMIKKRMVLNVVAVLVIHLIGVSYFYLSGNVFLKVADELFKSVQGNPVYTGAELSLGQAFLTGSLVFIPLDLVSAIVGAIIGEKVSKVVNN